jgi:hypothetical protein
MYNQKNHVLISGQDFDSIFEKRKKARGAR